jgi:hypothetical protein
MMADGDQTCLPETNESSLSVNLLQVFCTVPEICGVTPLQLYRYRYHRSGGIQCHASILRCDVSSVRSRWMVWRRMAQSPSELRGGGLQSVQVNVKDENDGHFKGQEKKQRSMGMPI